MGCKLVEEIGVEDMVGGDDTHWQVTSTKLERTVMTVQYDLINDAMVFDALTYVGAFI
jgi:hypothetical protein